MQSISMDQKSAPQELYSILQLSKGPASSAQEIRDKHKKLVLLHHPDRHQSKPRAELDANAEQFAKVQEAFKILNDPVMRTIYDASSFKGLQQFQIQLAASKWRKEHPNETLTAKHQSFLFPQVLPTVVPISTSLMLMGGWVTIRYKTIELCGSCFGRGCPWSKFAWDNVMCVHCQGTGQLRHSVCPTCGGSGRSVWQKVLCKACEGGQVQQMEHTCFVYILPGDSRTRIVIPEYGSQQPGYPFRQSLVIPLEYENISNVNSFTWIRKGCDLYTHIRVPLVQAYTGIRSHVQHLDGRCINVVSGPIPPHRLNHTISCIVPNQGLVIPKADALHDKQLVVRFPTNDPRSRSAPNKLVIQVEPGGHLFIQVEFILPTNLNTEQVRVLVATLGESDNTKIDAADHTLFVSAPSSTTPEINDDEEESLSTTDDEEKANFSRSSREISRQNTRESSMFS
jgi:DnaJ-class molecular chaperone